MKYRKISTAKDTPQLITTPRDIADEGGPIVSASEIVKSLAWCARLHLNTLQHHKMENGDLHVVAPEDGEFVCLRPAQLQAIRDLCDRQKRESLTLLQGRDGTLYLLLDDLDAGQRIWVVDELGKR